MIILDTDVVTLLEYGTKDALRRRIESVGADEEVAVTIITQMERLQGRFDSILKAATEAELLTAMTRFRATEQLLGGFHLLEIDEGASRQFERLRKNKRLKMKRGDMLIASIALAHKALLVTRNVKDYELVTGLRVENWAE